MEEIVFVAIVTDSIFVILRIQSAFILLDSGRIAPPTHIRAALSTSKRFGVFSEMNTVIEDSAPHQWCLGLINNKITSPKSDGDRAHHMFKPQRVFHQSGTSVKRRREALNSILCYCPRFRSRRRCCSAKKILASAL